MAKTQILLPLAKQVHWEELRYAIRSWEEHIGELELFTVGPAQPDFLKNKHPHLMVSPTRTTRWASITNALIAASKDPRLADEFVYMNDDIYLLGSYDPDLAFYQGTLEEKIESFGDARYDSYRMSIQATLSTLQQVTGRKTFLNFETHTPLVLKKSQLVEAAKLAEASSVPLQLRSLAVNLSTPKVMWVGLESDVKVRESGPVIDSWPHLILSSQDSVFDRVRGLLEERFPKPAKAELPTFEGPSWSDLGGSLVKPELPEEWLTHPGMRPYNPSLAWLKGKLYMSVRYAFFWHPGIELSEEQEAEVVLRKKSVGKYGVSHTLLCELEPDSLELRSWKKLESKGFPDFHANDSLEDVRLFEDSGKLFGIGVFLHEGTENHEQAIARLAPSTGTFTWLQNLGKPAGRTEKNWSPVEGSPGRFQYSPTQVWEGELTGATYKGKVHGGTQLLKLEDGSHISLVHSFVSRKVEGALRPERHYVHYFARWVEGKLVELSEAFSFGWEKPIEFASGLAWSDSGREELLVSYGIGDSSFGLGRISLVDALATLKPYDPSEERQVVKW